MAPHQISGRYGKQRRSTCMMGAALLAALTLGACSQAVVVEPGFSVLEVSVAAVPKKGMKSAQTGGPVAGGYGEVAGGPESSRAFERVDYKRLDGVVVWAEPSDGQKYVSGSREATESRDPELIITGDAHQRTRTIAVHLGGKLRLVNDSSRPLKVYSVTDDNEFSLTLNGKSKSEWLPKSAGPVEVLIAGIEEPVAIAYVTPSPWTAVARGGDVVRFTHMPPGHYEVASWHARLPGTRSPVLLTDGKITVDRVIVGVDALQR